MSPITVQDFRSKSWGEVVHVKGFGNGIKAAWKERALAAIGDSCRALAWDGDPPKADGFTALIEAFLRACPQKKVIAFKDSEQLLSFQEKWKKQLDEFGDRIVIVAVDKAKDKEALQLSREDVLVKDLPTTAREFYFLGRIAIKATGSKKVVSVGGGGISGKEAEASFEDGVSWIVLAVSRGRREKHDTLLDWAHSHPGPKLTFVQGIDDKEREGYKCIGGSFACFPWFRWCVPMPLTAPLV